VDRERAIGPSSKPEGPRARAPPRC
jgi:hypothetical protein